MGRHSFQKTITVALAVLACALLFAVRPDQARAQESPSEAARGVIDHVLQKRKKSPAADLGAWSRKVMKRALDRVGKNASKSSLPLPAEDQASSMAGDIHERPRGPEVIIFMSLSAPPANWRQWSREAARIGAPLVLRGLAPGGLQATVKRVGAYLDSSSGAAIDPRLFRLFDIKVIPAVAVVPGGVPPCKNRECAEDAAPPYDRVIGNIGLEAALDAVAKEGEAARATARRHLARLRGDSR